MQASRALFTVLLGVLLLGTISGCGSSGDGENEPETLVTVRGRVDDGTATSPIAHAACRFVHRRGRQLAATTADHSGTFRLTVPSDVEGFIVCSPPGFPNLALVTFVSTIGVSAGETIPIGDIARATHGIVRMETIESLQGRRIADTDDDGLVCSLRKDPQQAAIQYRAAAAAAFTATTLFNALLIEAQNPAMSSYEDILADVLLRTTETGSPLLEILATDLTAGGVPARRATGLATLLNRCIQAFVEETLGIPLSRMVQAGRLRVTVRDEQGTLLPRAQATVEGAVILAAVSSNCESVGKQTVCRTDENGLVIIVLEGEKSLAVTPVLLIVESEDGALTSQMQVDFLPPRRLSENYDSQSFGPEEGMSIWIQTGPSLLRDDTRQLFSGAAPFKNAISSLGQRPLVG